MLPAHRAPAVRAVQLQALQAATDRWARQARRQQLPRGMPAILQLPQVELAVMAVRALAMALDRAVTAEQVPQPVGQRLPQ